MAAVLNDVTGNFWIYVLVVILSLLFAPPYLASCVETITKSYFRAKTEGVRLGVLSILEQQEKDHEKEEKH